MANDYMKLYVLYYRPLRHNLFYLNDKIKTLYSNINRRLMLAA